MTSLETSFFGLALFAALATLLQCKSRRALNAARLKRGLREYVTAGSNVQPSDSLSTAALEQI